MRGLFTCALLYVGSSAMIWQLEALQESICCPLDSDLIISLILMQIYRKETAGGCIQVPAPAEKNDSLANQAISIWLPHITFNWSHLRSYFTQMDQLNCRLCSRPIWLRIPSLTATRRAALPHSSAVCTCFSIPHLSRRETAPTAVSQLGNITQCKFNSKVFHGVQNLPNYPWSNDAHF